MNDHPAKLLGRSASSIDHVIGGLQARSPVFLRDSPFELLGAKTLAV